MAKSKEEIWIEVHAEAIEEFERAYASQQEVREQCYQDRRFVYVPSALWDGDWGEQYANRPKFEVNKCHNAVMKIIAEYKNNRITVDFRSKNGDSDSLAETLDGLYRADEESCNAREAYDNCFDEGVSGGMGAYRIRAKYEDEDDEDNDSQTMTMEPIFDADLSVFFGLEAKRQDKSDAIRCWVLYSQDRHAYEEEWGPGGSSFDKANVETGYEWFSPDVIYVAEYYKVEKETRTCYVYLLPETGEEVKIYDEDEGVDLEKQGFILARKKKMTRKRVHKYLMDGSRILEDCGFIAGPNIPIVPYYAKRGYVKDVERIQGHVRLTTDVMRLYNMLISLLGEIAITSQPERPIFTDSQINGKASYWSTDTVNRYPYGLINDVIDPATGQQVPMGVLSYTKPTSIPPAIIGLLELCNMDMKELLGSQENGEKMIANVSARAVELVQKQLSMQPFIYIDSFSKAMKRGGEIWLGMAKELHDEEGRKMRSIGEDGKPKFITLKTPTMKEGVQGYDNDLQDGDFDVVVDVAPAAAVQRDNTVKTLLGILQYFQNPADQQLLTSVLVRNLDGEGIPELKKWARRNLLEQGLTEPTEEEKQEIQAAQQNKQPDPNSMYLMAEADKSKALATKAEADTMKSVAEAEQTRAETAKILTEADSMKLDSILKIMQQMQLATQPPAMPATQEEVV